jgi:hypothetical protein
MVGILLAIDFLFLIIHGILLLTPLQQQVGTLSLPHDLFRQLHQLQRRLQGNGKAEQYQVVRFKARMKNDWRTLGWRMLLLEQYILLVSSIPNYFRILRREELIIEITAYDGLERTVFLQGSDVELTGIIDMDELKILERWLAARSAHIPVGDCSPQRNCP